MDNFDLKKYIAEGRLLKEAAVPSFENGWEVIKYLDNIPEFKKYRNEDALYDDEYYLIPTDVFTRVTGWTQQDVETIDDNLEPYELKYIKNKQTYRLIHSQSL